MTQPIASPPADFPITDRTYLPVRVIHRSPKTGRIVRRGLATERDDAGRLMVWWVGAPMPTFHSLAEEPLALELGHPSTWTEAARALAERVLIRDERGTPSWAPEDVEKLESGGDAPATPAPSLGSCYAPPASFLLQRCGASWILMAFGVTAAAGGRPGTSFVHAVVFSPPADHTARALVAARIPDGADLWEIPGLSASQSEPASLSTIWSLVQP